MKEFLKIHLHLNPHKEIVFDNERIFTDNFMSMECVFINDSKHTWLNGYKIYFNGVVFSFKTLLEAEDKQASIEKLFREQMGRSLVEL